MRLWTSKEIAWLKTNYRTLGRAKCAERLGRSSDSVKSQARYLRILSPPRRVGHLLDGSVKHLIASGYTGKDIAADLGISYWTIKAWAKRNGVQLKGKTGKGIDHKRWSLIIDLLSEGFTITQVAKRVGSQPGSVCRTLRQQGFDKHGKRIKRGAA